MSVNLISFWKILRYLISGSFAFLVHLSVFIVTIRYFHLGYLFATCLAFLIACSVSFLLQKYWTFQDASNAYVSSQFSKFLFVGVMNFFLNLACMYFLVDTLHINDILAQFLSSGLIAFASFFIYGRIIFNRGVMK